MNKTDLRVIKTKKLLFDAFINILSKKSFDKIKITDICNEALINRSTFYAHYDDKENLLKDLFETKRIEFLEKIGDDGKSPLNKDKLVYIVSKFIEDLDDNKQIFFKVVSYDGNKSLWKYFVELIETNCEERIKNNSDVLVSKVPVKYAVKYHTAGIVNVLFTWANSNESKEKLYEYFNILIPEELKN